MGRRDCLPVFYRGQLSSTVPYIQRIVTDGLWKSFRNGLSGILGTVTLLSGFAVLMLAFIGFMTTLEWVAQWDSAFRTRHYPLQQIMITEATSDFYASRRGSVLEGETVNFRYNYIFAGRKFLAENRTNNTDEGRGLMGRLIRATPAHPISALAHINPQDPADAHLIVNGPAFSNLLPSLARLALTLALCVGSLRLANFVRAPELPG